MKIIRTIYILLLCVGIATLSQAQNKERRTIIEGYIPEAVDSAITVELHMNFPEEFLKKSEYLTTTIKGKFRFEFKINTPRSYVVSLGDDTYLVSNMFDRILFIEPGDSLNFKINDLREAGQKTEITGIGTAKYEFLKTLRVKEYSHYQKYGDTVTDQQNANPEWIYKNIETRFANYIEILKPYEESINPKMYKILLANGYIRSYADQLEYLSKVADPDIPFYKNFSSNRLQKLDSIYNFLDDINIARSCPSGYSTLERSILVLNNTLINKRKENLVHYSQHRDEYFQYLIASTKGKPNGEFLVGGFLNDCMQGNGLTYGLDKAVRSYLNVSSPQNPYYKQIETRYKESMANEAIGKEIPNFTFKDIHGKGVSLRELKGKVVLFDFWYTGCTNCIQIQPHIKEIEQRFKDNFVVVSVSIDRNSSLWKKGIGLYSSRNAIQLYTGGNGEDHPMINYFNFNGYPVLILMGKKGELIVPFSERLDPRDPPLKRKLIDKIEKAILN
jgi:thiol-disulfide isomerase/thioredoxin